MPVPHTVLIWRHCKDLQRPAKVQDSSDSVVAAGGRWCTANLLSFAVATSQLDIGRALSHCANVVRLTNFRKAENAMVQWSYRSDCTIENQSSSTEAILLDTWHSCRLVHGLSWCAQVSLLILQHLQVSTWCSPWDSGEYVSLIWDSLVVLTLTRSDSFVL
jgi:hypothetical protein